LLTARARITWTAFALELLAKGQVEDGHVSADYRFRTEKIKEKNKVCYGDYDFPFTISFTQRSLPT
jgi:hypothetical protein